MRPKILIPEPLLRELYLNQNLSPASIAQQFGCTSITVRNRILEAGITLKSKSRAQTRYPKRPFTGSDIEKAYILGFRYGDLNVYKPKGKSKTIVVRSHTTHRIQQDLFSLLFNPYGTISTSHNGRRIQSNCYLDESFQFLLQKYNQESRRWVNAHSNRLWAFAAGYIDAEGTFGLNQGKGRFKVDSYDKEILDELHEHFSANGIRSKRWIIANKGENDYGWVWKKNLWRVAVNEAASLEKLIICLRPYLRHKKRAKDAEMVLTNIEQRRRNGTIA